MSQVCLTPRHVLDTILKNNAEVTHLALTPDPENDFGALDIVNYTQLTHLDLRKAGKTVQVRVNECPNLRKILLPEGQSIGATVYLSSATPLSVRISGTVRVLDVAWFNGAAREYGVRLPLDPVPGLRFEGAYIGPLPSTAVAEPLVIFNDNPKNLSNLVVENPIVAVMGLGFLNTMETKSGVSFLRVERCPDLLSLTAESPLDGVHLSDLRKLKAIDAEGEVLKWRGGKGQNLGIQGLWGAVYFANANLGQVGAAGALELQAVNSLIGDVACFGEVSINGRNEQGEEAMSDQVLEQYTRMMANLDKESRKKITQNIGSIRGGAGTRRALELLYESLVAGEDPIIVWESRMVLRKFNMTKKCKSERHPWGWQLRKDLGHFGWLADLKIWMKCIEQGVTVEPGVVDRRDMNDPVHLVTMARLLGRDGFHAAALRWLNRGLSDGIAAGKPLKGVRQKDANLFKSIDTGPTKRQVADIKKLIEILARNRRAQEAPELVKALSHWIVCRMPYKVGADLLAAMSKLGSKEARQRLVEIIANPNAKEDLKAHALMLFMIKPTSQLLVFEESDHGQ